MKNGKLELKSEKQNYGFSKDKAKNLRIAKEIDLNIMGALMGEVWKNDPKKKRKAINGVIDDFIANATPEEKGCPKKGHSKKG